MNDNIKISSEIITIAGKGYLPLKELKHEKIYSYKGMPNKMVCNYYNSEMV